MENVNIRAAKQEDVSEILKLIKCLSIHLDSENEVINTEEALLRDGFGNKAYFKCLVAEASITEENNNQTDGQRIVGYVAYFFGYSSKQGRILYLDDFLVIPEYRNQGVGILLLRRLANVAAEMNCSYAEGISATWNAQAATFYTSIGAKCCREYDVYHLEKETLREYVCSFLADEDRRTELKCCPNDQILRPRF